MAHLSLHAGDQVHLPTTILIDGKSYRLIEINSSKSQRHKGLYCIQNDLTLIEDSIQRYLEEPSHDFEHLCSLVITYRKCFGDNKGGRKAKLEEKRDLRGASQWQLDFHERIIELGNQYVAHADNTLYDQSLAKLALDDHGKAVAIQIFQMQFENFTPDDYQGWLQLIALLKNKLAISLKELSDILINDYNESLLNKVDSNQKL